MSHRHTYFRYDRIVAELQGLDAGYPPEVVLERFIDALPEGYYQILKNQFVGVGIGKTNVLSAYMAGFSDCVASSKDSAEDVLLVNDGRRKESKGEGILCLLCHKMGHYARVCRPKKHAIGNQA